MTVKTKFGWQLAIDANVTVSGDCKGYHDAVEKLAEYEDTGLEPAEIMELKKKATAMMPQRIKESRCPSVFEAAKGLAAAGIDLDSL